MSERTHPYEQPLQYLNKMALPLNCSSNPKVIEAGMLPRGLAVRCNRLMNFTDLTGYGASGCLRIDVHPALSKTGYPMLCPLIIPTKRGLMDGWTPPKSI